MWVAGTAARKSLRNPDQAPAVRPSPVGKVSDQECDIHAQDALAPLLSIALVHVQFETIHP
jgi:Fic family protein